MPPVAFDRNGKWQTVRDRRGQRRLQAFPRTSPLAFQGLHFEVNPHAMLHPIFPPRCMECGHSLLAQRRTRRKAAVCDRD